MERYEDGKEVADTSSYPLVAVCIDRDKNSQNALKWAIDTLVHKGQTIVLVHVNTKGTSGGVEDAAGFKQPMDLHMRHLFLPFRCFCTRKGIQCKDVVLDDHDIAKSIIGFSTHATIEKLVIGATARGGFVRFKADIPTTISQGAPNFCTVYVINKGKVSSVRNAIRQAPCVSPLQSQIQSLAATKPPELVPVSQRWWWSSKGHEHGEMLSMDNYIWLPFACRPTVAVCIDEDKNSQNALKWAIDTLVEKDRTIFLVHVNTKGTSGGVEDVAGFKQSTDPHMRHLFLPFRCFCTRKDIQCKDVVLDGHDIAKSIIEFSAHAAIEKLVIGATTRGFFVRSEVDIPTTISKGAPDFCTVYVINKGKVSSVRNSICQAPRVSPLRSQIQSLTAAVKPPELAPVSQRWSSSMLEFF